MQILLIDTTLQEKEYNTNSTTLLVTIVSIYRLCIHKREHKSVLYLQNANNMNIVSRSTANDK